MMYLFEHPILTGKTNVGKYKNCIRVSFVEFSLGRKGKITVKENFRQHGLGLPECSGIKIHKPLDESSPKIFQSCLSGKVQDANIYFLGNNNKVYLEINLSDCALNEYEFLAHGGTPSEQFYLTFTKISFRYIPEIDSPYSASLNVLTGEC